MVRIAAFILLFSFLSKMGKAQERYGKGESKFITKFPFTQLTGGVVLLKAAFNDIPDSLNFILDTGSGAISLDSATVDEFDIPNVPSGRIVTGIAGSKKVNFATGNTLHLPGLSVDSLDFFINDYELLSSVYGIKIDGIIGYSFLSRYIVALNYDHHTISVFTPGSFDYARGSHLLTPDFTALPIQPLTIKDDRKLTGKFYLDTGAGLCFLLTSRFIHDSAFLKKKRKPVSMFVQGANGKKELEVTIIRQLQIGPYRFRNVPTNILHDDFNALSYPLIGGLIGNDLMRRFNVVLNYPEKVIAIKPNTHFKDLFDYSYTGMNLYTGANGEIVVDDVVAGSPADKHGLRNGDVIVGVNNNFSNSVGTYRDLLQHTGERTTLFVLRDEKIKKIDIRIGRIY